MVNKGKKKQNRQICGFYLITLNINTFVIYSFVLLLVGCAPRIKEVEHEEFKKVKEAGRETPTEGLAARVIVEEKKKIKKDPITLFNLANAERKLRKYDKAIELYKSALSKQPGFIEAWVNLSSCYIKKGDLSNALNAIEQAIMLAPENPVLRVNKSIILNKIGRYNKTIEELIGVIKRFGPLENALFQLGYAYYKSGKPRMAIFMMKELNERFKKNYRAHHLLGLIYEDLGYFGDALSEFKKALEIKPDYYEALVNIARLELKQASMDEAERHIAGAIRANPRGGEAHLLRGILMRKKGNYREAEKEYKIAIRYLEDDSQAFYNLANLYQDYLRNPKRALAYLEKYLKIIQKDPTVPETHIMETVKRVELLKKMNYGKIGRTKDAGKGENFKKEGDKGEGKNIGN